MTPRVVGLMADDAVRELESRGLNVRCIEYVSRRGVPDADEAKVIRQRPIGNNTIELTISHFKTRVEDAPQ